MKTNDLPIGELRRLVLAFLLTASLLFAAPPVFAQGPLTPPGPPAATMKTLDQIEARTPISSLPFTISASGSYYLTKNLNVPADDAITITADQVTLDLNGFTITSTSSPASGYGVVLANPSGNSDVTIFNGHIKGAVTNSGGIYSGDGFLCGVMVADLSPRNIRVTGISVSGCTGHGILLSSGGASSGNTLVDSCTVQTVGSYGILAGVVSHSGAYECGIGGISADSAADCVASSTDFGFGILARSANNCYGVSTGSGNGVTADVASNCRGSSNSGTGIAAILASNCQGGSVSNKGISAISVINCYGNSVTNRGISVEIAFASHGTCGGGSFGLNASQLANSCSGFSGTGTGLATNIAIGCVGNSITSNFHYNMPP